MDHHPFLIPSPYDADEGNLIGRDPREISAQEWRQYLSDAAVGLKAIRAKCLDCCGGNGGDACHLPAGVVAEQAPLTKIPPAVGHAPEGGNGPGLRLVHAQCWGHLKRVARWLEDSWVGDLIGAICLFGTGYLLLLFGWALS